MVANVTTSGPPSSMILPSSSGFWIASTTHRAASSRRIGCSWTSPYAGMITNGLNLASRSKASRKLPSSPRISEKRRIVPATPLLASSCSPIHREVKYLKCGSSRAPMLLTSTTDLAPAALAASAMIRGPSTLTSRNDWGRFRRTATRLMMCSVPWAAWAMAAGFRASPTRICAPRALKAAAFIGSRTRTLSWCPPSISLWATPRPKKPVDPSRRTLATGQNRNGERPGGGWNRHGNVRGADRGGRHRGRDSHAEAPGGNRRHVWRHRGNRLHGRAGRVLRCARDRGLGSNRLRASSPALDHVSFFDQGALGEPVVSERRDVDLRRLIQEQLGEQQRRSRRLHESMAAEPRCAPEALQLSDRPEDRLVVGRRFIEARPRRLHAGARERRGSSSGLREHLLEELPVDVFNEARRLFAVAHADQDAIALRVEVQRGLEVDGHRIRARHRRKSARDSDVPPIRQDRNLETGHAADRWCPRPCAVEHQPRGHVARRRANTSHMSRRDIDTRDRDPFLESRAEAASGGRVARCDVGWARDAVAGAERAAEDVLDVEYRHHTRGLARVNPSGLGQPDPVPHLHVVVEVLDLLRLREYEQVADLPKVRRVPDLLIEALEHRYRHPLQPDVALARELLAHTARALAGRLRAQRLTLHKEHVHVALAELVGQGAAHDPPARDDDVSAFHARTIPRTRRSASGPQGL